MKAMIIKGYGDTETFESTEIEKPAIKPNHVLVRIAATSVNPADTKIRQFGKDIPFAPPLPAVLGMDFAGTIEEVGDGVTDFAIGDDVFGCAGGVANLQGTLAEYLVADVDLISHKPKNLSMREAAALPLVGITAYEGLERAGVCKGQQVLVYGGTGGVGHIAVQLARCLGADVYATSGNAEKAALIKDLGATVIDYRNETTADFVERYTNGVGFDVVFDSVGGENILNAFEASKLNGQVATTSSMVELDLTLSHLKGISLHVVFMLIPMIHNLGRKKHGQILKEISKLVEEGQLRPILDKSNYSLEEINAAHSHLLSGQAVGKVVITV